MPVSISKQKNVSFSSGFSYNREVYYAEVVSSSGASVSSTLPLPNTLMNKPPKIEYYIIVNGRYYPPNATDGIQLGCDSDNIYVNGLASENVASGLPFTISISVYDRPAL